MFASYLSIKNSVQRSVGNQHLLIANSVARTMDIESYKRFLKNPVKSQDYQNIKEYLENAREKSGAVHIYTFKVENPRESRIMIAGLPEEVTRDPLIGELGVVPERQVRQAYEGGTFITDILDDPIYGEYLTAGVPIKDEDGTTIGFLGVDASAEVIHSISDKVIKSSIFTLIYAGAFVIILAVTFTIIQKWYRKELEQEVWDAEDTYRSEFQSLMASVRSLRHDYSNHVKVVHGLLKLGESDKAVDYLTGLTKEIHSIESMELDVTHPGLSVLRSEERRVGKECPV